MMEEIGRYLIRMTVAAIISGVLMRLIPKSSALKGIMGMLCGIFLLITMVDPWLKIPKLDLNEYIQSFTLDAQRAAMTGVLEAEREKQQIITTQVATYILDKAESIGAKVQVEVHVTEDELAIPDGVTLIGSVTREQKTALADYIANELGISREDQIWIE